jgi:hypothetical protein
LSDTEQKSKAADAKEHSVPFGVNEMRLTARQWLAALAIFIACAVAIPRVWKRAERFDTGADYRIPYALSSDYWLFQRRLEQIADPGAVPVLGDSVVWGEYVRPTGTLTHFLNGQSGGRVRFLNCGVNGVFPLAMEGLVAHYGQALHDRKVIVQYNMLWMSSPKADLSLDEEQTFNHTELVPQLFVRIPSYRADAAARLNAIASRDIGLLGWAQHVDAVYYDHLSLPAWTLEEDTSDPPRRPNAWRSPLAPLRGLRVPGEPAVDPQRGPDSPRHRSWTANGAAPSHFEWVSLADSLQWRAFQRTVALLRQRGNNVFVILGPFNEWMVAEDQRQAYRKLRGDIAAWLASNRIDYTAPEVLPSALYADASHPLTDGYSLLAARVSSDPAFQRWLAAPQAGAAPTSRR